MGRAYARRAISGAPHLLTQKFIIMTARERLMQWAEKECPDLAREVRIEEHEEKHGPHFDELTGTDAVARMRSKNGTGEHWNYAQVTEAVSPFVPMMGDNDTTWDAYVLLNMWYHDLADNYKRHDANNAMQWLVEDAVTWGFADEDAPAGKIWRYINAMG